MIILRAALGIVFFAHGSQKLFGWFGGYGFDATVQFFQQIRIPSVIAILVILGEFFGGIMVLHYVEWGRKIIYGQALKRQGRKWNS